MTIKIEGANENNLKNIDVEFGEGLTVVSGISGSGKSSLVYDTLYHEARRRFMDIFTPRSSKLRLPKARVKSITGISPSIAVDQNVLNRNPNSTLATAVGLHPFLRILFANFSTRFCPNCSSGLEIYTEDAIIENIQKQIQKKVLFISAPITHKNKGSHKTLLGLLQEKFDVNSIIIDGMKWNGQPLSPNNKHTIEIVLAELTNIAKIKDIRETISRVFELGASVVVARTNEEEFLFNKDPVCTNCGYWFKELQPKHFHMKCNYCNGKGCERCQMIGLHPEAASARWQGKRFTELLTMTVDEVKELLQKAYFSKAAERLKSEITKRIDSLQKLGLGYLALDRSSPTLSRGEAQRVRMAIILTSELEDMIHILDEPTIGQHPHDVIKFLPAFRELAGPVIYVEHDRIAASIADQAIDIGPGAGRNGGQVLFNGPTQKLWEQNTPTGRYFSFKERVKIPKLRPQPEDFLTICKASLRNLKGISINIPLNRFTVITGVSGSGKSTIVEDVLFKSLSKNKPIGCQEIVGPKINSIIVDQSPIGRNPRSNPATYTKLSDVIRDLFAEATDLTKSHFSFNRKEGQCPKCNGIGAEEIKLPYIVPLWLPCEKCSGKRFKDEVLGAKIRINGKEFSIADFYELSIEEATPIILSSEFLSDKNRDTARDILKALTDIGLGYLHLGQSSTTLSGGEAQRVKLAKFLGRKNLYGNLIILDEPSTGLHPQDISGLLIVLDRLVRSKASIVVVEHNTDVIRAADWIVDLGPGAGPNGGELLFEGVLKDLMLCKKSLTAKALEEEEKFTPELLKIDRKFEHSNYIKIKGARANNLKNIDVNIPKGKMVVVTGVSGSGKSSLVNDVLELEARRRFLESLSLYERQSINEGPTAPVDSISGLGVTAIIRSSFHPWRIDPRYVVGNASEMLDHLFSFVVYLGEKICFQCGSIMKREENGWHCLKCNKVTSFISPEFLSPMSIQSCCDKCKGLGFVGKPNIDKMIIHPEKPFCKGALYSPGFWPQNYYCKPLSYGYYVLQAVAKRYHFDPEKTPWNETPKEAQEIILYGSKGIIWEYEYEGRKGKNEIFKTIRKGPLHGIFSDWGDYSWFDYGDLFETYSDKMVCDVCKGQKLKPEYLTLTLNGFNIHQLRQMPLSELEKTFTQLKFNESTKAELLKQNWEKITKRLKYLCKVGLGYLNCDRPTYNLSAGEYERLRLASTLGSGLTCLTILLDEPTRGLHPTEVHNLLEVLAELRDEGNTVIVVEHDLDIISNADYIIDIGPGAGKQGGEIIAKGNINDIVKTDTITAKWLKGERRTNPYQNERRKDERIDQKIRRKPTKWITIKGAKENNLKGEVIKIPLGVLVGICGVSGSGKSTLIIDTLGLELVQKEYSTLFASERIQPGKHEGIEGAPKKALLVDQSKTKIYSPVRYFSLEKPLMNIYVNSEEADALGITEKDYTARCSSCLGRGEITMDMGFLPAVRTTCDLCMGTGYVAEAWEVKIKGYSLPELSRLTLEEIFQLFKNESDIISRFLQAAIDVGLGYLVLEQPAHTLSGGEAQRMKIAKELCKKTKEHTLYILDEPSLGQHLDDVERLIGILKRLVDEGNSVLVVEHHPNILAACDWLLELGPVGGPEGGYIIASNVPEEVAIGTTPTAPFIKQVLEELP